MVHGGRGCYGYRVRFFDGELEEGCERGEWLYAVRQYVCSYRLLFRQQLVAYIQVPC